MAHAVDMDKVRQKKKEVESSAFSNDWITPKIGENRFRILPPWSDEGVFYLEVGHHYKVPGQKYPEMCPRVIAGQPCPFCEVVDQLRGSEKPEDIEMVNRWYVRRAFLMNVINRAEEAKGPQVLKVGKMIFEDILRHITDPNWGDITHPETGHDMIVDREGKDLNTDYKTRGKPQTEPLHKDGKISQKWLASLKDLSSYAKYETYAVLKKKLEGDPGGVGTPADNNGTEPSATVTEDPPQEEEPAEDAGEQTPGEPPETEQAADAEGRTRVTLEQKEAGEMPPCFGNLYDAGAEECMECQAEDECRAAYKEQLKKRAAAAADAPVRTQRAPAPAPAKPPAAKPALPPPAAKSSLRARLDSAVKKK